VVWEKGEKTSKEVRFFLSDIGPVGIKVPTRRMLISSEGLARLRILQMKWLKGEDYAIRRFEGTLKKVRLDVTSLLMLNKERARLLRPLLRGKVKTLNRANGREVNQQGEHQSHSLGRRKGAYRELLSGEYLRKGKPVPAF